MDIMLDLDGVLIDWMQGAIKFHGIQQKFLDGYPCPGQWNWVEYLGYGDKFWEGLGHHFYANLPWTSNGREILDICCGYGEVYFLTSCTECPGSASGKIAWLQREVPSLSKNFIITRHKKLCSGKGRVLIDDADHNIKDWNGPSILFPTIWNSNMDVRDPIGYLKSNLKEIGGCE